MTIEARAAFIEFFAAQQHTVVPSAPLVPFDDPTLLFVNAGMVPFKNYFTGAATPPYSTAVSSQKCVRAGGKHNDLDNVGYTARHHTFFEMLGNFSFGKYFKEQAIVHASDFIFNTLKLPRDKITVTVYHTDDEAANLWRSVANMPEQRIIRIASSDNFWSMGDTGPCGPCSEIFYDHGAHIAGGPPGSADADGDRFVEIWNLVFMQYEQHANGTRTPLPAPCVDTGMGLERLMAVLHNTHDNYATPVLRHLINASADLTNQHADGALAASHRVIADHMRAAGFLLADGVMPAPDGRGYVLRRIMRRAMRHAHILGASAPLMHRLVPTLIEQMGQAYPELVRAQPVITQTLYDEEERFRETLARGLKLLDEATADLPQGGALAGDVAFKLYDTYGFPVDLTADVLRGRGLLVDQEGFEATMQRRKQEDRAGWHGSGDSAQNDLWLTLRNQHAATVFTGYESLTQSATVQAIVHDGAVITQANAGQTVAVLCDTSCFYAESGGQTGDTGILTWQNGTAQVLNTTKAAGDLFVHTVRIETGTLHANTTVQQQVDAVRRDAVRAAHSATHLLHATLRQVLGAHVTQKGSSVLPNRLRFDFSHNKAVTPQQLQQIEDIINGHIRANLATSTQITTPEEAQKAGALALFGEKYGDKVRVLALGDASVELCGGTHVQRTGDIGLLLLQSESGVAAGVRRIEAVIGDAALQQTRQQHNTLQQLEILLKTTDVVEQAKRLLNEKKQLEKALTDARRSSASNDASVVMLPNGVSFDGRVLTGVQPKDLPSLIDAAKAQLQKGVIALLAMGEDKITIAVGLTDDLTQTLDAAALARAASLAGGGKGGGGRRDFAQAGAPDTSRSAQILDAVRDLVAQSA